MAGLETAQIKYCNMFLVSLFAIHKDICVQDVNPLLKLSLFILKNASWGLYLDLL